MLVRVYGRVVHPHGVNETTPITGDGVIEYVRSGVGRLDGAVHGGDRHRVSYTGGVVEDDYLAPGEWLAYVYPSKASEQGRSYSMTLGIPETGEITLGDALGVVVDDKIIVKGESGQSAYEIAQIHGYTGTEAEWLESLEGPEGPASGLTLSFPRPGIVRLHDDFRPTRIPWSTNPLAAAAERPITGLWYDEQEGVIYSGYGDWTKNGDEIGVVTHTIGGRADTVFFPAKGSAQQYQPLNRAGAYTEAIQYFTRIGDAVYIPHIDGAGFWEGCGYITNEGGTWHEESLPGQAVHVFQIISTDDGMWACGSSIHPNQVDAGATLWFRPTGGEWSIRYRAPVSGDMSFSRYYKMLVEDGRVCVRDHYTDDQVLRFTTTDMDKRDMVPEDGSWAVYASNEIRVENSIYRGNANGVITRESVS